MDRVNGLHHITAIAGPAQENLDFYAGVLGMALVKRSVNQDDPGTYHLFYADAEGHPGTDLTFFPWAEAAPARPGHGLANEVALAVLPGSLEWWAPRLARYGTPLAAIESRFGERTLRLRDPHGLEVALVEMSDSTSRPFTPLEDSPVPSQHQIRGLQGARLREHKLAPTVTFLTEVLGFRLLGSEDGWHRYVLADGGSGRFVDVAEAQEQPRGFWG